MALEPAPAERRLDLALDRVGRVYDDGVAITALHPTTLTITDGEYVAVTGPSGSGKSTLLNILGLLDRPSAGEYTIGGVATSPLDGAARTALRGHVFGFVFQAYHLLPGRSLVDNVELGMVYGQHARRDRRDRAYAALDQVMLADQAESDPRRLSGEQRQRVAVARALAAESSVLLCDEPTGNLDSGSSERLLDLLGRLNRGGLTLVVVTHDLAVASRAARVLDLMDGVVGGLRGFGASPHVAT